ncbi:MAG: class I SAM-dependent methyltransferase [Chloroflexota bacterium]|nr:class I SAM-dependent methyltransferase [Chloroflexota bacterium]
MVTQDLTPLSPAERGEKLVESLFGASIATMELFAVYLGDRLGYYRDLAESGAATSTELAQRTNTNERYTREWLEQQAMAGVLDVEDTGIASTRRFRLPAGHDEVLTDRDSLSYMSPMVRLAAGCVSVMPALLEAFRNGGGVPYPDYGQDTREGIADMNRVMFINELASEWLPALPDIHQQLLDTDRPARVADIGCGTGWSSIAIAQGFPATLVDGFDVDNASIETANVTAVSLGLQDRVTFEVRDAGDPTLAGAYDFACAFECIHDMANPIATLAAMRRLVGAGGTVLIADERVADVFDATTGDEIERLMYGFSILHCLPVGMADAPSVGTGTVMRFDTFRAYAEQAGFQNVEVLPIDNIFWRFYRLTA